MKKTDDGKGHHATQAGARNRQYPVDDPLIEMNQKLLPTSGRESTVSRPHKVLYRPILFPIPVGAPGAPHVLRRGSLAAALWGQRHHRIRPVVRVQGLLRIYWSPPVAAS
jgi:hypothetical protein